MRISATVSTFIIKTLHVSGPSNLNFTTMFDPPISTLPFSVRDTAQLILFDFTFHFLPFCILIKLVVVVVVAVVVLVLVFSQSFPPAWAPLYTGML
jgi:hypothetical protein